jgi:hypothetical protein
MTGIRVSFLSTVYQKLYVFAIILIGLPGGAFYSAAFAQTNEQLTGQWQLQKIGYKKLITGKTFEDKAALLNVFKIALYAKGGQERNTTAGELASDAVPEAEILTDQYYQSIIEFKASGACYLTAGHMNKSFSGEYMVLGKKLMLEWETADKSSFYILKITAGELVLKDEKLKVVFHYIKL